MSSFPQQAEVPRETSADLTASSERSSGSRTLPWAQNKSLTSSGPGTRVVMEKPQLLTQALLSRLWAQTK